MMASRVKSQFFEQLDRELDRRGMGHQQLAEMISEARVQAGREPLRRFDLMAKSLRSPRRDTGISSATIEEICSILSLIPVLSLISISDNTREGEVPDDHDMGLLALCDRDDMSYRASVDDPDMNRLRMAGLVAIGGADSVSWHATEAGHQLLASAAPVGVCEFCRRFMYPGQTACRTDGCCGEKTVRPCEICARLDAATLTCSGTMPHIAEDRAGGLHIPDPLRPPESCPQWTPDEVAYHRRLFQVAERGILITGDE